MKRLVAKISIKPKDSKNDDFTLALVDYFNAEFKKNNLKSKKNNGYVKVALNGKYKEKYDYIIVDCCNGKVYLRGVDVKDKYFGRLSKFNANRKSDAYHCVNYNATRLVNRINKINASFEQEKILVADLRQKKVVALFKKDIENMICKAEEKKSFIKEFSFNKEFSDKIREIFKQYYEKFINSEQYANYVKSNSSRIENLDLMQIMEDNHLDMMVVREVKKNIDVSEYKEVSLNDDIQGAFWGYCNDNEEILNKCKEKANVLLSSQTKLSKKLNPKRILDLRTVVRVADLRGKIRIAGKYIDLQNNNNIIHFADDKKEFLVEMANDKQFHDKVFNIFQKYCMNFVNSDIYSDYIKSFKSSQIAELDPVTIMEDNNINEKVIDEVKKEIDIDEYDETDLNNDIDASFWNYLNQDEELWEKCKDKVKNAFTTQSKSLAEELSSLNDAPGRQIQTKDVDNVDVFNRDKPFLYYNGDILIGNQAGTHSQIVSDLLGKDEDRWKGLRPDLKNVNGIDEDDSFGFGHIVDNIAFIDDFGMKNCTIDEIGKAVVKESGVDKAYTSPNQYQSYFERVANKFKKKFKRILDLRR